MLIRLEDLIHFGARDNVPVPSAGTQLPTVRRRIQVFVYFVKTFTKTSQTQNKGVLIRKTRITRFFTHKTRHRRNLRLVNIVRKTKSETAFHREMGVGAC